MFGLFYSLVLSLFHGEWISLSTGEALSAVGDSLFFLFKPLGHLLRNVGLELPDTFSLSDAKNFIGYMDSDITDSAMLLGTHISSVIASVIAVVISIGIIVVALKGIKRMFTILFTLGR